MLLLLYFVAFLPVCIVWYKTSSELRLLCSFSFVRCTAHIRDSNQAVWRRYGVEQ